MGHSKDDPVLAFALLVECKNTTPSTQTYGPDVDEMQAGQAVHANFNLLYAVTPQFQVGINGYWLNQISDTKINGHEASGRREKVFALGPGALFILSRNDSLAFNMYFETETRNRPEGNRINLRWVHKI